MKELDILQEIRNLTHIEIEEYTRLKTCLEDIYLDEEKYWKQRSKQKWLEEGDHNSKYFHVIANHKRKKNRITSLRINNSTTQSIGVIKKHVLEYYKEVLGTSGIKYASLDSTFWGMTDQITSLENHFLESPFTYEEIKTALFDCEPNGAPGPDGIPFKFYQTFWDTVKQDLFQLCASFYHHNLNLDKLNKSVICLIPKESNAATINKYRPISLVNCIFKLLSKILTHR